MGFPRQEYWRGLPFPSPGHLPGSGIQPESPALAGKFITTESLGKPGGNILLPQIKLEHSIYHSCFLQSTNNIQRFVKHYLDASLYYWYREISKESLIIEKDLEHTKAGKHITKLWRWIVYLWQQ